MVGISHKQSFLMFFIIFHFRASKFPFRASENQKVTILLARRASKKKGSCRALTKHTTVTQVIKFSHCNNLKFLGSHTRLQTSTKHTSHTQQSHKSFLILKLIEVTQSKQVTEFSHCHNLKLLGSYTSKVKQILNTQATHNSHTSNFSH